MLNNLKKGDVYKKFRVLSITDIPDYKSTGIHLRHEKTGLEIFHMLNDDEENLFSFSFRTPNEKSNGAAHILEHSVLCGSERFPLKDPFIKLANQSVKTYLNALTYPEHTVFPASSTVKKDYFNLMAVYGDAVFFPRLDKEIFMQEAHRLELDSEGKPCIQGVVYNEMKGAYSSFESIAFDSVLHNMLKGCVYEKDSGGDPLEIPSITHEELKAFHRKWYRSDNCFVFLYGNIPTEEQLDFIDENFIGRLEERNPDIDVSESARRKQIDDFIRYVTPSPVTEPFTVYEDGPAGEENEKGNTVLLNWRLGFCPDNLRAIEYMIVAGILINHDGSPLQKALVESGLGEDLAPGTGMEGSLSEFLFSAGLRGVKKGNEHKVEKVIFDCLEEIVKNGISRRDFDATLMSLEFSQREIRRAHGPYSLKLMNRPVFAWMYGLDVTKAIRSRKDIELVREKLENDKNYLVNLIRHMFLDNKRRSLTVITPSKKYTKEREKLEKKIIAGKMKSVTPEKISEDTKLLHDFQSAPENTSCIPHLKPADFLNDIEHTVEHIETVQEKIKSGTQEVDFFANELATNGIIYFDIGLPCDLLESSDYLKLPLFAETLTNCGFGKYRWDEAAEEVALHINMLGTGTVSQTTPDTDFARKWQAENSFCSREWVLIRAAFLEEELEPSLKLLSQILTQTDFSDLKRLQDIANEMRNDADSSVIPSGHDYAMIRTKRTLSRVCAVDEIWNGLTSVFELHKLAENDQQKNAEDFRRILNLLKQGGAIVHVTAEKENADRIRKLLPAFINDAGLKTLTERKKRDEKEFYALTDLGAGDERNEILLTSSAQVGFAAQCSPASPYGTKESAAEDICTHWLSNSLLWEKLRTIGGAYGAFCDNEMRAGVLVFSTYRDPSALKSCDVFNECLKESMDSLFEDEELEKAVTGTYSRWIQPRAPGAKGYVAFMRRLYGLSDTEKSGIIRNILTTTKEELRQAFSRLYKTSSGSARRVVIGPKTLEEKGFFAGNIINLPL